MKKILLLLVLVVSVALSACAKEESKGVEAASISDNVQTVSTTFSANNYSPITVQKDVPVKWTITVNKGDLNNCNNRFFIPAFDNKEVKLKEGENVVEFTPTESGTFPYSCWMGMIHSKIVVVDKLNASSKESADADTVSVSKSAVTTNASATNSAEIKTGVIENDVQKVNVTITENGYEPAFIIVQKGIKTEFKFDVKAASCAQYVVFPQTNQVVDLSKTNTVTVTPEDNFQFACDMSMYGSTVLVVDDIKNATDVESIKKELEKNGDSYKFQGSGCGGGCCGAK